MTTLRKRIEKSTADDHSDAAMPDQENDGLVSSEPKPAKRCDRAVEARRWPYSRPGRHLRPIMLEAMRILESEGWIVGKIMDKDLPFDIIGSLDRASIFVKAVWTKNPVRNAKETARMFCPDIRKMQPFWNSDGDNLQFWVFSRVVGLLRYRVYRGGIWNEATRTNPELQEPRLEPVYHRMRATA